MKDETGRYTEGKMNVVELLEHMEAVHRGYYRKRRKPWPCPNVFRQAREYIERLEGELEKKR